MASSRSAKRFRNFVPLPAPLDWRAISRNSSTLLLHPGGGEGCRLALYGRDVAVGDEGGEERIEPVARAEVELLRLDLDLRLEREPDRLAGLARDGRIDVGVGELVCEGPGLGRLKQGLEGLVDECRGVLEDLVGRAEARLHGAPAQEAVGEAVDGADEGGVGGGECRREPVAPHGGGLTGQLGEELLADPELELSRGLAGEGDGGDAVEGEGRRCIVRRRHHLHQAAHEERGLPGSGAGVDEQVLAA